MLDDAQECQMKECVNMVSLSSKDPICLGVYIFQPVCFLNRKKLKIFLTYKCKWSVIID